MADWRQADVYAHVVSSHAFKHDTYVNGLERIVSPWRLSATFYDSSCQRALGTIRSAVTAAVNRDPRMGASLLRLHFHDCFVQATINSSAQGCDASVLLADAANFTGEQNSFPNRGSLRGFDVVDSIKAQVEAVCPRTVSCADILAVAARDAVVTLGGPPYMVLLGRRDSTTASLSQANSDLPPPGSDLASLISGFARKGLSTTDMVALSGSMRRILSCMLTCTPDSPAARDDPFFTCYTYPNVRGRAGAHTIGQVQCANFRSRLYNESSSLNPKDAASLRASCPQSGGDGNLAPMDLATPNAFDGAFFGGLLSRRGVLHSDQQLFSGGATDALVRAYASNAAQFRNDFAGAMVRMGGIAVLNGSQGQIRLRCSKELYPPSDLVITEEQRSKASNSSSSIICLLIFSPPSGLSAPLLLGEYLRTVNPSSFGFNAKAALHKNRNTKMSLVKNDVIPQRSFLIIIIIVIGAASYQLVAVADIALGLRGEEAPGWASPSSGLWPSGSSVIAQGRGAICSLGLEVVLGFWTDREPIRVFVEDVADVLLFLHFLGGDLAQAAAAGELDLPDLLSSGFCEGIKNGISGLTGEG
ncbi:LOW QUALITY PROTEIN: hypothetical protein U9M48_007331 [Paspalum notatum var. saurae]|uniref:Plant heme peroxidase family profile domain-containing protein n=1 Tax=Paspalum notatum var. saurae TaxID=547442 RepID=A0AAQ3PWH1_PASNO